MARLLPLTFALVVALWCAPAQGAATFTITGAGFGHGVGMSQYGTLGYAQRGFGHEAILRRYYTGTRLGRTPSGGVVRVLLQSPRVASFTGATRAGGRTLRADRTYRVARALSGQLELQSERGRRLAGFAEPLSVTGPGPLTLRGTASNGIRDGRYRGWLEFRSGALGDVVAVNAVGLEQYVAGVVSAESPPSWPLEALKAQAVAARTYAITTDVNPSGGYDQYADTRSQVYTGVRAEFPSTNQAVNATRDRVVTYGGRPVTTFFFSTSGGRTENIESSFLGARPQPWLKSVADPYDSVSPVHRWRPIRLTLAQAGRRLGGLVKGSFRGIVVRRRGASPRVVSAEVVGSRGRTSVTGPRLRTRLGLRDTWMYFTTVGTRVERRPSAAAPAAGGSAGGGVTPPSARAAAVAGGALAGTVVGGRRADRELRVERRARGRWTIAGLALAGGDGSWRATVPSAGSYRVVTGTGVVGPVVRVGR